MSGSGKCKDNLNFCAYYGAAEKNQAKKLGAAEKKNKKLRLSALASQY